MATTKLAKARSTGLGAQISGLRVLDRPIFIPLDELLKDKDCLTVGRTRQRNVRVRHPTVSRSHCEITRTEDGRSFIIRDCGSKNGIYVAPLGYYSEYQQVDECVLQFGMHIRLGDVTLTPVDQSSEAPVFVKGPTDLLGRIIRLYGSYRETSRHLKVSHETLRARWLKKIQQAIRNRSNKRRRR